MEATIGYGGTAQRVPVRPVFVAPGSEAAAAVGDEGWSELERAFFVGGAVLDHNLALLSPLTVPRRAWAPLVLGWGALALLAVTSVLLLV